MTKRVAYTVDEVARVLRCSPQTVRRFVNNDTLTKVPNLKRVWITPQSFAEAFNLDLDDARLALEQAATELEGVDLDGAA